MTPDHAKFREALDNALKAVTLKEAQYYLRLAISHMGENPTGAEANLKLVDQMLRDTDPTDEKKKTPQQ